ncbi:MAG: sugar efflux transporter [Thalassotalea sp.]
MSKQLKSSLELANSSVEVLDVNAKRRSDNSIAKLFIILSILTGLIGAFVNPLMSYFIVEGLNSPPIYIGLYTGCVTLSGLVISQWLGNLADKGSNVKKLYLIATLGTMFALLVFITTDSFYWVLFAGVVFMGFGNASIPQMLIIGRQWAGNTPINIAQFNARVRAGMSFSWMVGPAIGFMLVSIIGFYASFSIALIFAVLAMLFMWRYIPEPAPKQKKSADSHDDINDPIPASFWLLGLAVMLGMAANLAYASALPLYTVKELNLPAYLPGVLMGIVACLEIPVMLYAAQLSKKWSKNHLMVIAFIFAMSFYLGMFFAETMWQLIMLQAVNAIFYGLYAGLGITIMQEQLPDRIGFTSTFYSNAMKVGMMLGTTCTGIIAQYFSFRAANLGAGFAALLALVCLLIFALLKQKELFKQEYRQFAQ